MAEEEEQSKRREERKEKVRQSERDPEGYEDFGGSREFKLKQGQSSGYEVFVDTRVAR